MKWISILIIAILFLSCKKNEDSNGIPYSVYGLYKTIQGDTVLVTPNGQYVDVLVKVSGYDHMELDSVLADQSYHFNDNEQIKATTATPVYYSACNATGAFIGDSLNIQITIPPASYFLLGAKR